LYRVAQHSTIKVIEILNEKLMAQTNDHPHPGVRIKAEVIPAGMTVTKAAQQIGVGRPALSNLLNGKAALTAEMAARLAAAFNYPLSALMELQARYEATHAKQQKTPTETKPYVPTFLSIKANEIEEWASGSIQARNRFAVLLRILVHSTGRRLIKVDFPGNDDAERPGWDGTAIAEEGAPWVPNGRSGWEFGTSTNPKEKAEGDFNKSVKAQSIKDDCADVTFVFVTPRRWHNKEEWIKAKKALRIWKDVRAYDASDLEQWIEQSISGQVWFAIETNKPTQNVRTLENCWTGWASVSSPHLSGSLFNESVEASKQIVESRLFGPIEKPIHITADSIDEALAFVAQLMSERGGSKLAQYRDTVLVFDKPGILPKLAAGAQKFIPVVTTREVERELASLTKSIHSFVIYPRNVLTSKPDIALETVSSKSISSALEEMGKSRDEIIRLEKSSGRSLTVLRRQLATVEAIRNPEWAENQEISRALVPFMLVGSWDSQNEIDKYGLHCLAVERSYEELEKEFQGIVQINDSPLWTIDKYRGVVSKIDLLHAISNVVTQVDLDRYFNVARLVLGEDDPALDLPESRRWAAQIYGKTREFSNFFRKGISETLVLLTERLSEIFKKRLGVDVKAEVAKIVGDMLPTPLTTRSLEANNKELTTYAEAAPDEFLSILEKDLKSPNPAVYGLLRPVEIGVFGVSPSYTGLLWALEGLSWNEATVKRAVDILAQLSQVQINDNWVNKPIRSLKSIFSAWMPQTEANNQQRILLIKGLVQKFPDISWQLCVAQIDDDSQIGHYNHKPLWRTDGIGYGEPIAKGPIVEYLREIVEIVLTWKEYKLEMLCALVERLHNLAENDQRRVWKIIESWAKTKASDDDKARLREKIRVTTYSWRVVLMAKKSGAEIKKLKEGEIAYKALEPAEVINRHAWLFNNDHIQASYRDIDDIDLLDLDGRNQRIKIDRVVALKEIIQEKGLIGVLELSQIGGAPWTIGGLMSNSLLIEEELIEFISLAFEQVQVNQKAEYSNKNLIGGALCAIDKDSNREKVIKRLAKMLTESETAQLLRLAPFNQSTWKLVDSLGMSAQGEYWISVVPNILDGNEIEHKEAVERLLKAKRPRAAFSCIKYSLEKLDGQLLFELLTEMVKSSHDQQGQYPLEHYYVEKAFEHLSRGSTLSIEEMAGLELAYIDCLALQTERRGSYGIPNLERYVEDHPEVFVQAISYAYKRDDGSVDHGEHGIPSEKGSVIAEQCYRLLNTVKRLPGHNEIGELNKDNLARWIAIVRQRCEELGRATIADVSIGKLLANSPVGEDGIWPCEIVRDLLEDVQSEQVMSGAQTGVYNSRGAHWRGEGGDQERELAEKYRAWGRALQITHPFVSSKLLMRLAETYNREAYQYDNEAGIGRRLI
jgi:addiction module HigA family antidote